MLPGRAELACKPCFMSHGAKFVGAALNKLPDPQALEPEARLKANALGAAKLQQAQGLQAFAQGQANAKLAGLKAQIPAGLQNNLGGLHNQVAGRLNSITDGPIDAVNSIVNGAGNSVVNAIKDGAANRLGNAVNNLNNLRNRFR